MAVGIAKSYVGKLKRSKDSFYILKAACLFSHMTGVKHNIIKSLGTVKQ